MNYLSLNLKTLKEAFGLTYDEIGDIMQVSKTSVVNYINETNTPSRKKAEDLADYAGVTYDDLTTREIKYKEAKSLAARRASLHQQPEGLLTDEGAGSYHYKSKEDPFDVTLAVHTGRIISDILDKHQTPREYYAKEVLKKDSRTLQRICKGEIMAGFDIILQVALDHNEPLELFRTGPLPKGHMLAQLRDKETIIDTQKQLINALQSKRA